MNQKLSSMSVSEKRAMLANLLAAKQSHSPLSLGQLRLWQAEQLHGSGSTYNISILYRLTGQLDRNALVEAVNYAVRRHDILRTSFDAKDGQPIQRIAHFARVDVPITEQCESSREEWQEFVRREAEHEAQRPFSLEQGGLIRCKLWAYGDCEFAFSVTVHHIVADRWSLSILARDITQGYTNWDRLDELEANRTSQYAEFCRAEGHNDQREQRERQLERWQAAFPSVPDGLRFPKLGLFGSGSTSDGVRLTREFESNLNSQVAELSRRTNTTPFIVLLAGFSAVLGEYTGQSKFIVCTPVFGRHRPGTKDTVGYFNNLLPLQVDISGNPTFTELLARLRPIIRDAFDNQDPSLQEIANLPTLQRVRLTQCLFSLQNTPSLAFDFPGIDCQYEDVATGGADFDLALFVEPRPQRYLAMADYKPSCFSSSAVERLIERTQDLLAHFAEHADDPIDSVLGSDWQVESNPDDPTPLLERQTPQADHHRADETADSELERRMTTLWQEVLGVSPLSPNVDFFELGGHSLLAARLFQRIEEVFGRQLPLSTLLEASTIRQLSRLLADRGWCPTWSSLVPVNPSGSQPPLFLVHSGGGNVITYRRLVRHLGSDQPLWGLQARGQNKAERPLSTVEDMAKYYVEAIRTVQPEGPYYLGGHSMGALVAYEMAQQLTAEGETVALLALLDHAGPAARIGWSDRWKWHVYCWRQLDLTDRFTYVTSRLRWRFYNNGFLPRLVHRLATWMNIKPHAAAKSSWRLRVMEASLSAMNDYKFRPFGGKLTLFRTKLASAALHSDASGGWGSVGLGGIEVHELPGGHMTMFDEPQVALLADQMLSCLRRAQSPSASPPNRGDALPTDAKNSLGLQEAGPTRS